MTRAAVGGALALVVLSAVACSASSSGPAVMPGVDAGDPHDATASHDARGEAGCASTAKCTGTVSGGVAGKIATCTVSAEQGQAIGIGKVTFNFTADGGAAGPVTGSGEVSTKGSFAKGSYLPDGALWNDVTAADSLWSVAWGSTMAQCNGTRSPDEIDSLCVAALDVTSVDACDDLHGTFDLTVPAYMGTPAITVDLAF